MERVSLHSQQSILILDSHPLFGLGLQSLVEKLETGHDSVLTGTFQDALERLDQKRSTKLAIIDVAAPGMVGPTTIAMLKSKFPHLQIFLVSAHFSREMISGCLALGASGCVLKSQPAQEISDAIGIVLRGGIYVPAVAVNDSVDFETVQELKNSLMNNTDGSEIGMSADSRVIAETHLSKQQQAVLRLMVKGLSNKGIARELHLAEGTVKVHVNGVFRALKVNSRVQAVIKSL